MKSRVDVIAEIGVNFNGTFDNCLRLIDAAAAAGCSAAKFQLFRAEALYTRRAGRLDWQKGAKRYSYDIFQASRRFAMPWAWIPGLLTHCRRRRIEFLASVFDPAGADMLQRHGVRRVKLASYAVTNLPLIEYCCRKRFALLLSTGAATLGEVEAAAGLVRRHRCPLTLLHCNIQYPTPLCEVNLGVLDTYRAAFPWAVLGFSDHTREVSRAPVAAVRLGARVIEKHVTLDKGMEGPDHFFALEPRELVRLVKDVNLAARGRGGAVSKLLYGTSAKTIAAGEDYLRRFAYMSLFAARDLARGRRIGPSDLAILRPGKHRPGLEPRYLELFRSHRVTARRRVRVGEAVTWESILG